MNPALMAPESKGKVFETPIEKYFELTQNNELKNLVADIRKISDHNKRREMKTNLPIRCPHYFRFKDNHRAQSDILSDEFTFQTCVDIDKMEQVEPALSRAYLLNDQEGMWKGMLLHVEKSASGKLHLDIRLPLSMTIREAQEAYTKELGIDFDEDCCTPERMIYITDAESQLYTSDDWYARLSDEELTQRRKAYTDRGLDIDGRERKNEPLSNEPENQPVESSEATTYPTEYKGIPYSYIVEELADQLGGTPEHGSRNSFIFSMACMLRHVCNDDKNWIRAILPNYGEQQSRVNSTIESACRRNQSATMPNKVARAIEQARARVNLESGQDADFLSHQPPFPLRLPAPIRLAVSKAPKGYHPCIANSIFTAWATYTGGVEAEYYNGTTLELTLIHMLFADWSIGKSSIKQPITHTLKPIEERDEINRQKDEEWAEECNSKSSSKDKPERPKDICIQVIDSDTTNAALLTILKDAQRAGNKAIFTIMDELEEMNKVSNGKKLEVTQILRRDFDTDKYGQERQGTLSAKGRSVLRWNLSISSTVDTAKAYFKDSISNGTFSRLNISTILESDVERHPKFKKYDEKFDKDMTVFTKRLEEAKGTINCPQAKKLVEELLDTAEDRALLMDCKAYEKLSYRAAVIAFRKAILLYIMNNYKWSKEIAEFVRWSFDYDLWVKMYLFGELLNKEFGRPTRTLAPGCTNIMEHLNDSFTEEEYMALYIKLGKKGKNPKNLLAQWKTRGWIEFVEDQKLYVKTQLYYGKHAA